MKSAKWLIFISNSHLSTSLRANLTSDCLSSFFSLSLRNTTDWHHPFSLLINLKKNPSNACLFGCMSVKIIINFEVLCKFQNWNSCHLESKMFDLRFTGDGFTIFMLLSDHNFKCFFVVVSFHYRSKNVWMLNELRHVCICIKKICWIMPLIASISRCGVLFAWWAFCKFLVWKWKNWPTWNPIQK